MVDEICCESELEEAEEDGQAQALRSLVSSIAGHSDLLLSEAKVAGRNVSF